MTVITPEVYSSMGLNADEYTLILSLLGREPTYTELGMFAVMWSEHCGYKYSRPVLALFKRYKEALEGEGFENAGIVELGDGIGVTMKVESHNHPSAVEPYQGAATGVGGIIRDILTMGARPIALLNSLRFGPIRDGEAPPEVVERNRYLFDHVVAGIAGYGNCVGVPTVAGEVDFHPRYSGNPLVNAMCVGILSLDEVTTAAAEGEGNPVLYLGSATGRDGIHGATFASESLGEDSDAKRPNVQIGDPFAEKLLIEATLEALKTDAIVAIQDMGAAGLTCSTIEMSSKGHTGMRIDLDLVPMREGDMSGYELMLSESQERMLAVAKRGREQEVIDVFHKWGLHAVVVGHVTRDGLVSVFRHGERIASVAAELLTDHCPTYHPESTEPEYFRRAAALELASIPEADPGEALRKLLAVPGIASKRWVFRQYDQHVQTQTVQDAGASDAAVLRPRGTRKGLAVKIDGNARQTYLHPYRGGLLAVAESARNVACTGAMPTAVTDGLNFGSPENPHVYWQFSEAVRGIAEAAEAMGTPVVSGNVSFYNESEMGEVPPTPLIGMLGVLEDGSRSIGLGPKGKGSIGIVWANPADVPLEGLGASAYLAEVLGREDGHPCEPDLAGELELAGLLVELAAAGVVEAAHDWAEGGLAVAVAEMAIAGDRSIEVVATGEPFDYASRTDSALFGELPSRVMVAIPQGSEPDFMDRAGRRSLLSAAIVGQYGEAGNLTLAHEGRTWEFQVEELRGIYEGAIEKLMAEPLRT
jgi:phosphoribosylformylglycinamidine synthase subunit PurL